VATGAAYLLEDPPALSQERRVLELLDIEVAGSVALSSNRLVYFKMDSILRGRDKFLCLEHKTGSRFSSAWVAQWIQKMQMGVYSHVLHCLYKQEDVHGVVINGAFFHDPPKLRRDGQPYANSSDNEFHRVPVRMALQQMEAWHQDILQWMDRIEEDHDRLSHQSEGDAVLHAFQKNTESCTRYGICPFLNQCSIWSNPLQHLQDVPRGFKIELWDPRDKEYVQATMEL